MSLKTLVSRTDFNFLEESQKKEKLKELLQKKPQRSLEDLQFFTALEIQEIVRLQKSISEDSIAQQLPDKELLREWKRIKSGKKKLIKEAWLEETDTQINLQGDFDGEIKLLATFPITERMISREVALKGAMNYLEIFWKDEMICMGELNLPETFEIVKKAGSFRETEFPYEPPGIPGLLDENF